MSKYPGNSIPVKISPSRNIQLQKTSYNNQKTIQDFTSDNQYTQCFDERIIFL